jgi:5-methyltetrahydrofolate--homocysteine methyltransferase
MHITVKGSTLKQGGRTQVETLDELKAKVMDMDAEKVAELTQKALAEGISAKEILNQALTPAMDIVGDEYERGDRFIPEMLLSANAMKGAMELLRPLLVKSGVEMKGKVVVGTVEGDLHDIGLNLVRMMLEGAGFEVYSLGTDAPAKEFVKAVKEFGAGLVGMSALLTTTMLNMAGVIEALRENGLRDRVKVMVGGAPVTQDYADEIRADGYAPDAFSAVKLAERLAAELRGKTSTID